MRVEDEGRPLGLYHLHIKNISRADGRSVVAAAAYRAGESLPNDAEQGESDFSRRGNVTHTEILTPAGAPDWMQNRAALWNAVEAVETRKDSRLAKEIECALPRDLPRAERLQLVRQFAQVFVAMGCVVDVFIHEDDDDHNPHVHLLLTTREITNDGFGLKLRELDSLAFVTIARNAWAKRANALLGKVGSSLRLDHRTLAAQGIDRKPTKHRGPNKAERRRKRWRGAASRPQELVLEQPGVSATLPPTQREQHITQQTWWQGIEKNTTTDAPVQTSTDDHKWWRSLQENHQPENRDAEHESRRVLFRQRLRRGRR